MRVSHLVELREAFQPGLEAAVKLERLRNAVPAPAGGLPQPVQATARQQNQRAGDEFLRDAMPEVQFMRAVQPCDDEPVERSIEQAGQQPEHQRGAGEQRGRKL
jgi:hypothetical protein